MLCLTRTIACVRLNLSIKYNNLMSAYKYICAYDRVPPIFKIDGDYQQQKCSFL